MNITLHKIKKEYVLNLLEIVFTHYFLEHTNLKDTPDNRKKIENKGLLSVGFYDLKDIFNNNLDSDFVEVPENLIVFGLIYLEETIAVQNNLIENPSNARLGIINCDDYFLSIKNLIDNNKFPDYFYPLSELVGFRKK